MIAVRGVLGEEGRSEVKVEEESMYHHLGL